jgi:DNA-binding NtrC family response regulator
MCRVLSVEYSIPYLVKRHVALRRAEVPVESASTMREALSLMRLGEFDVAVLGHGIPDADRNRIAEALLELKPTIRVIMMYSGSIHHSDRADAVLSLEGEQHLVPTIKSLFARMKASQGVDVLKRAAGF